MILEGFVWKGDDKVTLEEDFYVLPLSFEDIERPLWSREEESALPDVPPRN